MVDIKKLSSDAEVNVAKRPTLERIAFEGNIGRSRMQELYNMFYKNGPGYGTMLSLPFDQLVEHGIGHAFKWERSADPRAVIELANRGTFSAMALSIGQAEKYQNLIRPDLPLIIKLDGHFLVGKDVPYPRHSTMSSVDRALEAGANAIGFTFYFGGENTMEDAERCAKIVEEAHKAGKPVFAWMYARGPLADKMGPETLYWCAQAVSAGESIGADVVKQKFPMPAKNRVDYTYNLSGKGDQKGYFFSKMPEVDQILELEPENAGEYTHELHTKRLALMAAVAPNVLKIISGGPKAKEQESLYKTLMIVMDSGNEGQIVGRNLWGRPIEEALEVNKQMIDIMQKVQYRRELTQPRFTGNYK